MTDVCVLHQGDAPLLVSVPHDGRELPSAIRDRMTPAGVDIPDTDWHVARLYDFAKTLGASVLVARYSRYVVDLNRPAEDTPLYPGQVATGLCPEQTFAGKRIYTSGGVGQDEKATRVSTYWRPYHDALRRELDRLRAAHGQVIVWDAHSIPGVVPRLFDGELPVLNLGTNGGGSCDPALAATVAEIAENSPYSSILDGRFKGGHITRGYGRPADNVHALQLEIAQRSYMDEETREFDESRASELRRVIRTMLEACLRYATGRASVVVKE